MIEWLRTMRSRSTYLVLYSVASFVTIVLLRIHVRELNIAAAVLIIAATCMVSDGVPEILKARRGGRLYDICGAGGSDYLLGFVTSVGTLVAALCLVQMVLLIGAPIRPRVVVMVGVACTASAFALAPVAVSIDHFFMNLRGGVIRRVLGASKVGSMVIVVPIMFFMLAAVSILVPLAIAGLFVFFEVKRARRKHVRQQ